MVHYWKYQRNVIHAKDSRTILDMKGAEKLLGDGDMLFFTQGQKAPLRAQGTFVSDKEIENVINFVKNQMVGYSGNEVNNKITQSPIIYMESNIAAHFTVSLIHCGMILFPANS